MSESQQGTPASELNAQTSVARTAQASAIVADTARSAPVATKRPSAATKRSNATKKSAPVTATKRSNAKSAPVAAKSVKLTSVKVSGPTDTQVKRTAATMLVKIVDDAYGKLSDAQIKRAFAPVKLTDAQVTSFRSIIGTTWGSSLNYIPTPADVWGTKLPARNFTGGRGSAARKSA